MNFLDDLDLDREQRLALLERTWAHKHEGVDLGRPLRGKHLALVMQKPSLRTRVSFTVAIRELGGEVIEVAEHNTKLGKGEDLQEWAGVLGRMVSGIVARVFQHETLQELARHSNRPVVNALCDRLHPCQALADAFTVWEHAKKSHAPGASTAAEFYSGPRRWTWVGDGNNVANSLMLTCANLGVQLQLACPLSYGPSPQILELARRLHPLGPSGIVLGSDPEAAVKDTDVIYTDTWISMGQEQQQASKLAAFHGFSVDAALLARAPGSAIVLHCLPAVPGQEVSAEVLRGNRSRVLDQAENRLFTSKVLLRDFVCANLVGLRPDHANRETKEGSSWPPPLIHPSA